MPPKPKIPLIPQIPQQDGDQVGPQVPLPPGQSDDDYIGKGVQTLLGLVGAGDDESRWNRFGQLMSAGIPISAPLIAGMKPEMIPYIRESGARMIQDVLENGMPQHLGNGIFDPTTRIPLSPEQAAALQYAQQRFPRLMGHVTGIGAIEPELAGVAGGAYSPQTLNPKFGYIRLNPAYADASTLGHELNHAADSLAIPNAAEQYESFNALPGGYAANSHEIRARNAGDTFQRHFDLNQLTEGEFKKLPNKLRKNDPNWDKGNVVPKPVGKPIPINTPNDDTELSKFRNADDFGKPLSKITNLKPCPSGQCYANSTKYANEHGGTIIHGRVVNGSGKQLNHAWVEQGDKVIDPTQGVMMDKNQWYGLVKAQPLSSYTPEEALINQLRTGHHGPWD